MSFSVTEATWLRNVGRAGRVPQGMNRSDSLLYLRTWLLFSALLSLLVLAVGASMRHAPRRQAYLRNVLR